ncbi:hypothetical protein MKEN_00530700 [Mycena kentingensis (nom. inval.)]|nr:hypothetical protein MKEN_00530700 [Mycena kentingensis (nom. inval.)]
MQQDSFTVNNLSYAPSSEGAVRIYVRPTSIQNEFLCVTGSFGESAPSTRDPGARRTGSFGGQPASRVEINPTFIRSRSNGSPPQRFHSMMLSSSVLVGSAVDDEDAPDDIPAIFFESEPAVATRPALEALSIPWSPQFGNGHLSPWHDAVSGTESSVPSSPASIYPFIPGSPAPPTQSGGDMFLTGDVAQLGSPWSPDMETYFGYVEARKEDQPEYRNALAAHSEHVAESFGQMSLQSPIPSSRPPFHLHEQLQTGMLSPQAMPIARGQDYRVAITDGLGVGDPQLLQHQSSWELGSYRSSSVSSNGYSIHSGDGGHARVSPLPSPALHRRSVPENTLDAGPSSSRTQRSYGESQVGYPGIHWVDEEIEAPPIGSQAGTIATTNRRKNPAKFLCDRCQKTFTKKHNLNFHIDAHEGRKRYMCDLCRKWFRTPGTLKRHVAKCWKKLVKIRKPA